MPQISQYTPEDGAAWTSIQGEIESEAGLQQLHSLDVSFIDLHMPDTVHSVLQSRSPLLQSHHLAPHHHLHLLSADQ